MLKKFLNNRFSILYIIPFCLGLLTVLSFQPFNYSFINFFILPFLFLLLVYVRKKSQNFYRQKPYHKNLFLIGSAFGFGFYLSGIFWITYSLTFDDSFKFLIPFALVLIPLFLSIFMGITTLIAGQYLNYNFTSILIFSGLIALSDYIRSKILSGFPWNLWGYSWSWFTEILQSLNILDNQNRAAERCLPLVADYGIPNVSEKVLRIILSYTDYINRVVWKKY